MIGDHFNWNTNTEIRILSSRAESISHSFASALEDKIRIPAEPYNILYIHWFQGGKYYYYHYYSFKILLRLWLAQTSLKLGTAVATRPTREYILGIALDFKTVPNMQTYAQLKIQTQTPYCVFTCCSCFCLRGTCTNSALTFKNQIVKLFLGTFLPSKPPIAPKRNCSSSRFLKFSIPGFNSLVIL